MSAYEAGKLASLGGKTLADNPHTDGFTKLGNVRLTEEGVEWQLGFNSVVSRVVSKKEWEVACRATNLGQFRSRHRRER